jgi:BirA family biotin operon repressor/biotin-[acetyl-CoA-carboxylase] ligase
LPRARSRRTPIITSLYLLSTPVTHNLPIAPAPPTRIDVQDGSPTDARLSRIVRLLSDNATVVISGARIAEELGTSRSEVWRAVQYLRQLGVRITGHLATGYQLMAVPDLLLPDVLSPLLGGTIFGTGSHLHHYFRIGSTNVVAMKAAAEGAPEGSVFLAEEQTAGRGRGDHTWESAESVGIYCSIVLRPEMSPLDALFLSLMTGIAAADAVKQTTGLEPDLRWPNDMLLNERKFCGILAEMNSEPMRVRYVVVGIGINVNHTGFPAELAPIATSLRMETGREWSRVELAAALLRSLDERYRKLAEGRPDAQTEIIRTFEQRSSWARGRHVRIADNGSGYEGITEGLNERGFLRLRVGGELRTVLSGNVYAPQGT